MERVFENYVNDIYVDVLNRINEVNLPVKFIRFFQKEPNLLMCELYTMSGEVNKFKRIVAVYSLRSMYHVINIDKELVSLDKLPMTTNRIDTKSDFYESIVAMSLLCAVADKLTSPASDALEHMSELAEHSYESCYTNINDISVVNMKRIAEIEDLNVTEFETAITSNTVSIEISKKSEKVGVKLTKKMEDYNGCDLADSLKIRILKGLLLVKYFMGDGDMYKFDCSFYQQSNTMHSIK